MELHFKECHQKIIFRPSNGFAGSRNLFEKAITRFAYSFKKKKKKCDDWMVRLQLGMNRSTSVNCDN
jgi:hypothetical protein